MNQNPGSRESLFSTGIGPMTDQILNTMLDRLTTDNFREKLTQKIVDPVTEIINKKIQPYIYVSAVLYVIVIILLIVIIYLIQRKNKN